MEKKDVGYDDVEGVEEGLNEVVEVNTCKGKGKGKGGRSRVTGGMEEQLIKQGRTVAMEDERVWIAEPNTWRCNINHATKPGAGHDVADEADLPALASQNSSFA